MIRNLTTKITPTNAKARNKDVRTPPSSPPNVGPTFTGFGRSKCRQPYPSRYCANRETDSNRTTKKFARNEYILRSLHLFTLAFVPFFARGWSGSTCYVKDALAEWRRILEKS